VDRRTLTVLVVAAAAIFAISLSAGTLTSTVESEGDGSDAPQLGGGDVFGINISDTDTDDDSGGSGWPTQTLQMVIALFVIAAVVTALTSPRHLTLLVALFLGLMFVVLLVTLVDLDILFEGDLLPWEGERGGGLDPGTGDTNDLLSPLLLAIAALVSVLLLGLVLVSRRRGTDAVEEPDEESSESVAGDDSTALGTIAGRAADRIEAGEASDSRAENEVYRAWREMTDHLDIEAAETATPREFQRHAIGAGMSSDDVRELTGLFEQVRYGGESATESREQRAVAVLRRIESTYGDAG
jgi:hypothetical protein